MKFTLSFCIVVFTLSCGGSTELTSEEAGRLLHSAVQIPDSLLREVADAGATVSPANLSTMPFCMLLTTLKIEDGSEDLRPLEAEQGPAPVELWNSGGDGHLTLLLDGSLSDIQVETEGDRATGTFRFRREGLFEGRAEFTAEKTPEGWSIVEFRLPSYGVSTRLNDDGRWIGEWPD